MLLLHDVAVVLHLVHKGGLLDELIVLQVDENEVPLLHHGVEVLLGRHLPLEEHGPELGTLLALLHFDHLLGSALMLLEQVDVGSSARYVELGVLGREAGSLPNVDGRLVELLDDKGCPGVEFLGLGTLSVVEVVGYEPAGDAEGVLGLVRADEPDSGVDRKCLSLLVVKALVEPDELGYEGHVGVGDLSAFTDELEAVVEGDLLSEDHVAENEGGGAGDALDAVDEDASVLPLCLLDEVDGLVKAALNVLARVVLEVEGQVLDPPFLVVVRAVVGSAVYHMSDSACLKLVEVPGNDVAPQVD
mmetsp:Transcript_1943/g.3362  ORF Transcript_1943/g.3362 Transcript_1943/m.3362 type:complete len:303 (-) Transcript_1943:1925-2833(-)